MKSHYDVLGVPVTATQEQIVTAYRLRSKVLHPDRFDPKKQRVEWELANELVKELNASYAVLRDTVSRASYDRANGFSSASRTTEASRSSAARAQAAQPKPPPPPRPSVVPPLVSGHTFFSALPAALQQRLRERCAGKIKAQLRVQIGGVITAYLLLIIVVLVAAIAFSSAGSEQWDSDTRSGAMLTIFIGFTGTGYSLFRLIRWHSSPLKQYLVITPLYVIETRFDELWYWPLWRIRGVNGTHRYYNGIYYGTDTIFTFENEKRSYRFRHQCDYKAVVEALQVFSQKALSAEQQYDLQYFADEDDFATVKSAKRPKRYRWKLAAASTAAAAAAALVFTAAIFAINSTAPKAKPVRLGAAPRTHNSSLSSPTGSNSAFEPSKIQTPEEPPYDPSVEPGNGYVFKNNLWRGGHGTLTIKNGTSSGAIVKLISTRLNSSVFTVFVAPNSDYTITNIPNETYRLAYAIGRRFNPLTDTFDRLYGISVFDQSLTYDTQNRYENDGVYTYYHQFEVTLQPVAGGNARTSSLAAQSFEQF